MMNKFTATPLIVDEKTAAKMIGMSTSFLRQSRMNGNRKNRAPAPPWIQIGRSVRYSVEDLDTWIMEHRCEPVRVIR